MNNFINSAREFANLLGIDSEADFQNHHRKRLAPKRFNCNATTQTVFTKKLFLFFIFNYFTESNLK